MERLSLENAVEKVFGEGLPRLLGGAFEKRPDQVSMARVVAATIRDGGVGVVEAGTGLGKSLAYLVPLILHCGRTGERAVVSTYTKNLQSQLIKKDFPLAAQAVGTLAAEPPDVEGAVLMGRSSYACLERLGKTDTGRPGDRARLRSELDRVSGVLDDAPAELFLQLDVNRAGLACPARDAVCAGCRLRQDCYMLRARRRALDAGIVFANHALVFSDFAASGALLGHYDAMVLDEAHHVEDVATDFFTVSYSPRSVRGGAQSIYDAAYEETIAYIRAMVESQTDIDPVSVDEMWSAFHEAMREADRSTARLFAALARNAAKSAAGARPEQYGNSGPAQVVYQEGAPLFYDADTHVAGVAAALAGMEKAAGVLSELVEDTEGLAETGAGGAMNAIASAAAETRAQFEFLVGGAADDHVFFARLDPSAAVTALSAAPVDMSFRLGALLEDANRATILTSATLAVGDDFSYLTERYGLSGSNRVHTCRYETPFDLRNGRLVVLPTWLPGPDRAGFLEAAAGVIGSVSNALDRRILVLCTARSQVEALAGLLPRQADPAGRRPLFVQSDGNSRAELLAGFRHSRNGLLIGLASFWEGIDLPGDQLELLVILKLPFLVPTEPVVQARTRKIADAGDNPFEKLFLPDVVLKLRQGMGRLIRTGNDRGAVILLDSRLAHNPYGDAVLGAVTGSYKRCENIEQTIEHIARFFEI